MVSRKNQTLMTRDACKKKKKELSDVKALWVGSGGKDRIGWPKPGGKNKAGKTQKRVTLEFFDWGGDEEERERTKRRAPGSGRNNPGKGTLNSGPNKEGIPTGTPNPRQESMGGGGKMERSPAMRPPKRKSRKKKKPLSWKTRNCVNPGKNMAEEGENKALHKKKQNKHNKVVGDGEQEEKGKQGRGALERGEKARWVYGRELSWKPPIKGWVSIVERSGGGGEVVGVKKQRAG